MTDKELVKDIKAILNEVIEKREKEIKELEDEVSFLKEKLEGNFNMKRFTNMYDKYLGFMLENNLEVAVSPKSFNLVIRGITRDSVHNLDKKHLKKIFRVLLNIIEKQQVENSQKYKERVLEDIKEGLKSSVFVKRTGVEALELEIKTLKNIVSNVDNVNSFIYEHFKVDHIVNRDNKVIEVFLKDEDFYVVCITKDKVYTLAYDMIIDLDERFDFLKDNFDEMVLLTIDEDEDEEY